MAKERIRVTQTAADVNTWGAIDTNISADSKFGWLIKSIQAYWEDGSTIAAADYQLEGVLTTVATATTPENSDEIDRISWGLQNTGGVAVAVPYEPNKVSVLLEERLTVQPIIYCGVLSSETNQANGIIFQVNYEIVKLTDIELLRLLIGGV